MKTFRVLYFEPMIGEWTDLDFYMKASDIYKAMNLYNKFLHWTEIGVLYYRWLPNDAFLLEEVVDGF